MNRQVLITATITVLSAIVLWHLLAEAVVYYEMQATGASSRAELADDMGLGVLLLVVVPPGTLILSSLVAFGVWRHFKRRQR